RTSARLRVVSAKRSVKKALVYQMTDTAAAMKAMTRARSHHGFPGVTIPEDSATSGTIRGAAASPGAPLGAGASGPVPASETDGMPDGGRSSDGCVSAMRQV